MKITGMFLTLVCCGLLLTAGCGGNGGDKAADNGDDASEAPMEGGEDEASGDEVAGEGEETGDQASEEAAKDIVDTAIAADGFSTLVAAVQAAELVETLKGEGPFTVFAPTDEAFANLPEGALDNLLKPENKDQLVSVLTLHVVSGKVMAADVVGLESAKTVQGGELAITVTDGKVSINDANVVTTDIECSNGVIHVIDAVILPPSE